MKIFESRKLTDAEFVEKIRKQLRINRRWAWIGIFITAALAVLLVWIFILFINFVSSMGQLADQVTSKPRMFYAGLALGCTMGLFLTVVLGKIFLHIYKSLELLFGNRRDNLLVAYYDQLHPLDAKAPAPSSAEKFPH